MEAVNVYWMYLVNVAYHDGGEEDLSQRDSHRVDRGHHLKKTLCVCTKV